MSLEGMDADQVQQVARQLDGYARALTHITSALGTLTGELSYHWQGPASAAFQQQWAAQHRAALGGAAQALTDMHAHLIANMQQQIQASAAGPGGGHAAGSGAAGGPGTRSGGPGFSPGNFWNLVTKYNGYVSLATTPFDYAMWSKLLAYDHNSSLLKYTLVPYLHSIQGVDRLLQHSWNVQPVDALLTKAHFPALIDTAGKGLGIAGAVVGGVSVGVSAFQGGQDLAQHHYASATGHLVDATAGGLKTIGAQTKDPLVYLAGFDISLAQKDYELARQIQWSQGIPNPFHPGVWRSDYVPTFKALPGQLVSTLAGIM